MTRREVLDIISEYNVSANIALNHKQPLAPRIHLKMMKLMSDGYAECTKRTHDEIVMELTEKGRSLPYDS